MKEQKEQIDLQITKFLDTHFIGEKKFQEEIISLIIEYNNLVYEEEEEEKKKKLRLAIISFFSQTIFQEQNNLQSYLISPRGKLENEIFGDEHSSLKNMVIKLQEIEAEQEEKKKEEENKEKSKKGIIDRFKPIFLTKKNDKNKEIETIKSQVNNIATLQEFFDLLKIINPEKIFKIIKALRSIENEPDKSKRIIECITPTTEQIKTLKGKGEEYFQQLQKSASSSLGLAFEGSFSEEVSNPKHITLQLIEIRLKKIILRKCGIKNHSIQQRIIEIFDQSDAEVISKGLMETGVSLEQFNKILLHQKELIPHLPQRIPLPPNFILENFFKSIEIPNQIPNQIPKTFKIKEKLTKLIQNQKVQFLLFDKKAEYIRNQLTTEQLLILTKKDNFDRLKELANAQYLQNEHNEKLEYEEKASEEKSDSPSNGKNKNTLERLVEKINDNLLSKVQDNRYSNKPGLYYYNNQLKNFITSSEEEKALEELENYIKEYSNEEGWRIFLKALSEELTPAIAQAIHEEEDVNIAREPKDFILFVRILKKYEESINENSAEKTEDLEALDEFYLRVGIGNSENDKLKKLALYYLFNSKKKDLKSNLNLLEDKIFTEKELNQIVYCLSPEFLDAIKKNKPLDLKNLSNELPKGLLEPKTPIDSGVCYRDVLNLKTQKDVNRFFAGAFEIPSYFGFLVSKLTLQGFSIKEARKEIVWNIFADKITGVMNGLLDKESKKIFDEERWEFANKLKQLQFGDTIYFEGFHFRSTLTINYPSVKIAPDNNVLETSGKVFHFHRYNDSSIVKDPDHSRMILALYEPEKPNCCAELFKQFLNHQSLMLESYANNLQQLKEEYAKSEIEIFKRSVNEKVESLGIKRIIPGFKLLEDEVNKTIESFTVVNQLNKVSLGEQETNSFDDAIQNYEEAEKAKSLFVEILMALAKDQGEQLKNNPTDLKKIFFSKIKQIGLYNAYSRLFPQKDNEDNFEDLLKHAGEEIDKEKPFAFLFEEFLEELKKKFTETQNEMQKQWQELVRKEEIPIEQILEEEMMGNKEEYERLITYCQKYYSPPEEQAKITKEFLQIEDNKPSSEVEVGCCTNLINSLRQLFVPSL